MVKEGNETTNFLINPIILLWIIACIFYFVEINKH